MTKRRDLKKTINNICSTLFAECLAASLYSGAPKEEEVDAVLASILHTQQDFVNRISHPQPGMRKKAYFKDLKESFNNQVNELIDHISNLH